jgi:hypothetical protein
MIVPRKNGKGHQGGLLMNLFNIDCGSFKAYVITDASAIGVARALTDTEDHEEHLFAEDQEFFDPLGYFVKILENGGFKVRVAYDWEVRRFKLK